MKGRKGPHILAEQIFSFFRCEGELVAKVRQLLDEHFVWNPLVRWLSGSEIWSAQTANAISTRGSKRLPPTQQ